MRRLSLFLLLATQTAFAGVSFHATRTPSRPVVDGTLEPLWQAGALTSNFIQVTPALRKGATMPTQVYFLYDDENVYLAARLTQPRPTIHAGRLKRDSKEIAVEDNVTFLLDALGNGNSAVFFSVNPDNAVADGTLSALGERDLLWDGTFESATFIGDSSWSVEIRIPLTTLAFQNKTEQEWGFDVGRVYAQNQEESVLQLIDENMPYRITDYPRLEGLRRLEKKTNLLLSPYTYFSRQAELLSSSTLAQAKTGGEVRYTPVPEMTLLATVNPDYAQLESDQEIINVSDVPASYPEKRPFFMASSDLYPGLAVNTRNIADIKAGLKARAVFEHSKYDLTAVLDAHNAWWLFGDGRITDNQTYYLDLIAGSRQLASQRDYNVTTNIRTWLFDKRLTAYTWFGTINSRRRQRNEWESVNAVKWLTRTFNMNLWNHFKTQYYDPGIVGSPTLSNEIILTYSIDYSFINDAGFWRTVKPALVLDYHDMFVQRGNGYTEPTLSLTATVHPSDVLGNWDLVVSYTPAATTKFRYRNTAQAAVGRPFDDAYSPFALVSVQKASLAATISSDQSRSLAGRVTVDTKPVRGSGAVVMEAETSLRVTSNFSATYNLEYAAIAGSPYQDRFHQTIQRVKLEYGIADRMNLRAVIQLNARRIPLSDYDYTNPTTNVTFSWEYEPGSSLYFVYNQSDVVERSARQSLATGTLYAQSIALKINKTFGL